MDKIIYFESDISQRDICRGEIYFEFLEYAFSKTDYFMLVYVNYYNNGYTPKQEYFRNLLRKFEVKIRTNPSWPGTLQTVCPNTTYTIIFYKNDPTAIKILKEADSLSAWSRPEMPEDLAFFKGNQCWFYSVGHEKIASVIHADELDIEFLKSKGLVNDKNAFNHEDDYYNQYDEELPCDEKF